MDDVFDEIDNEEGTLITGEDGITYREIEIKEQDRCKSI
jgi:hypothetical protein